MPEDLELYPKLSSAELGRGRVLRRCGRRFAGTWAPVRREGIGGLVDDMVIEMSTDSSGAKAFASRRGLGRIRHVEVRWLWLQQAVADGRFRVSKVLGTQNPADVLTKYKNLREYVEQLKRVGVGVVERASGKAGRSEKDGIPAHGWLRLAVGEGWADAVEE